MPNLNKRIIFLLVTITFLLSLAFSFLFHSYELAVSGLLIIIVLTAFLPALALFALGGCAGTSALTSSEDDGVYYSSKDHTTAIHSIDKIEKEMSYDGLIRQSIMELKERLYA